MGPSVPFDRLSSLNHYSEFFHLSFLRDFNQTGSANFKGRKGLHTHRLTLKPFVSIHEDKSFPWDSTMFE